MKGKRGFASGISGNPAGRPKGSSNAVSLELKSLIDEFLKGNFKEAVKTWKSLKGKDKLKFYTDLLSFRLARPQQAEISILENLSEMKLDELIYQLKNEIHEQANQN
jgi:hypothetical protein